MSNIQQKVAKDAITGILASIPDADDRHAVMKDLGITGRQTVSQLQAIEAAASELDRLGLQASNGRISVRDVDARLEERWPLHGVDTHLRSLHATRRITLKTKLRRAGLL